MEISQLLSLLGLNDFVVIDFETTGLDTAKSRIIEIAAVRFSDGEATGSYQQLIDPGEPIPCEIIELTNISDEMVAGQPAIEDEAQTLIDFVGASPLVAHNIRFDLAFLNNVYELLGAGRKAANPLYDTLSLGRTVAFHHNGFSLGALCDHFGIKQASAHRAYDDALNTGHLFLHLVEECASLPLPVIQTLLAVQSHIEIPNKALYIAIANAMTSAGQVKGLTVSKIKRPVRSAVYEFEGAGNFEPVPPQKYFGEEGVLKTAWPGFEPRPVQIEFAEAVATAMQDNEILIAEAGTGLGKSMAYVLPAISQTWINETPVVVSCQTKHLQEQLFYQEIPRVVESLEAPVKAVLLKGRSNYLCRTRLETLINNAARLLGPEDCEQLLPLLVWEQVTRTGDIDECPGFTTRWSARLWAMLRSERGYCLGKACGRYNGCFLGPVRRAAKSAGLLVVNHALLIADSADDIGLLPEHYNLVVDEAHNLAKVATDQLTLEFGENAVRNLTENYLGSRYRRIFRNQLRDALSITHNDNLYGDIQSAARVAHGNTVAFMEAYGAMLQIAPDPDRNYSTQLVRYVDPKIEFRGLEEALEVLAGALTEFIALLRKAHEALSNSDLSLGDSLINELGSDLDNALMLETAFRRTAREAPTGNEVLWREQRTVPAAEVKIVLRCAPLDVGDFLSERIFERRPGTVMCSATLQVNGSFDYYRREVGLSRPDFRWPLREMEFPSPFLYEEQCLIFNWETGTDVTSPEYAPALAELIYELTDQVERRLLVLFTSYAQLRAVHESLYHRLHRSDRLLITQYARSSRGSLLHAFRE
ncbi:MAG: 3'-5' exoribonuclease, partial [Candidatus Marinimicrobia bacterium]|nr:3'-5' exoribonuclease [Candidatus Neomarinimicrobiota bacterium]